MPHHGTELSDRVVGARLFIQPRHREVRRISAQQGGRCPLIVLKVTAQRQCRRLAQIETQTSTCCECSDIAEVVADERGIDGAVLAGEAQRQATGKPVQDPPAQIKVREVGVVAAVLSQKSDIPLSVRLARHIVYASRLTATAEKRVLRSANDLYALDVQQLRIGRGQR